MLTGRESPAHRRVLAAADAVDARRRQLLARVETLDPERLTAKPNPAKWSVLETVEHLVRAEQVVLCGLPDPSQLVARRRKLKHYVLHPLVRFVLKHRLRATAPEAMLPSGGRSLAELRAEWDRSQAWFRAYVSSLDEQGLRRAVFRHFVAGPLTPEEAIRLDLIHIERHAGDIEALIGGTALR